MLHNLPCFSETFSEYGKLAIHIAQGASDIVKNTTIFSEKWKPDGTPVTQVDITINTYVIDSIRKKYSDHTIYGEEESFGSTGSDYKWICDPIDGTIPFILGMPFFSFSLALTYKGDPFIGVVAIPSEDKLIYAEKGKGAYCNGEPIFIKKSQEINHATYFFTENWGGSKYDTTGFIQQLTHGGYNAKVFGLLSIVYAGIQVALGRTDGVIFPGTTAHDVAALAIIIQEAGGVVTDIHGNYQKYDTEIDGFLGVAPSLQGEILGLLSKSLITK